MNKPMPCEHNSFSKDQSEMRICSQLARPTAGRNWIKQISSSFTGVNGRLYEADIVLTNEDKHLVDQREEGDADGPEGGNNVIRRNAVRNRQKLWKTRVLPYRISPALCES